MSCPSQSTQLAEFHNVILTTQLVEFLVSSNSPTSPVHHWAINSPITCSNAIYCVPLRCDAMLQGGYQHIGRTRGLCLKHEDGGGMFLRNADMHLPDYFYIQSFHFYFMFSSFPNTPNDLTFHVAILLTSFLMIQSDAVPARRSD